jgi:hypothetical protein
MMPHSGGMPTPIAEVSFALPPGYVLDVEDWPAPTFDSGAGQPGGRVRCWDRPGSIWRVCYSQGEDGADRVSVATENAGSGGSALLELGVRRER